MDISTLIKRKDLDDFSANYEYPTDWLGTQLFPREKTDDLEFALSQLEQYGNIPSIAKVHAFDTEARIGSREKLAERHFESLLIKEKLPTSEKAQYALKNNDKNKALKIIYDDLNIEMQRVLTRTELENMQVISTGKLTINENNVNTVIEYGYDNSHDTSFTGWSDPTHDIIGDINLFVQSALKQGKRLAYAVTSSKIVSYLTANKGIGEMLKIQGAIPTVTNVLNYIYAQFGLQIATNDELYKIEGGDNTLHRFFPENKISFLTTLDFGKGYFAPTPDELTDVASAADIDMRQNVYLKSWKEQDPSTVWTMGSAVYLPAVKDINGLYIATVAA